MDNNLKQRELMIKLLLSLIFLVFLPLTLVAGIAWSLAHSGTQFNLLMLILVVGAISMAVGYKLFSEIIKPLQLDESYNQVMTLFNSAHELEEILEKFLLLMDKLHNYKLGAVYFYREEQENLQLIAVHGTSEGIAKEFALKEGLVGTVAHARQAAVVNGVDLKQFAVDLGFCKVYPKTVLGLPIICQGILKGVIILAGFQQVSEKEVEYLQNLTVQLAISLKNIEQFHEQEKLSNRLQKINQELFQQKNYAKTILKSIADGVYSTDLNRRITNWSTGAERITGYKEQEIGGRFCGDFLTHCDQDGNPLCDSNCPITQSIQNNESTSIKEVWMHTKDGRLIPVAISVGLVRNEEGKVVGAVEVFRDITVEKRSIEQIKQASKAKSDFVANMTHELRTPLNAIIGISEILREEVFGPLTEKQAEYISDIEDNGKHLLSLINNILDLSKIEAGKMTFEGELFELESFLKNCLNIVKERALKQQLQLSMEAEGEIGYIYNDQRKLKQIIYNLLSNAVKFTPSGGQVGIKCRKENDEVYITVWDTGIGIPAEYHDKIFAEFTQVDSALNRSYEGTGLGLALVKKMLAVCQGRIELTSEVGKGSQFTVIIPVKVESEELTAG